MVEGAAKYVKYALYVANVVVLIGGIVVFSVGVWTLADRSFMERLLGSNLYISSAAILIATGIIVTIVSFLGCFGGYKEIKCMLLAFFISLFLIFIIMLVGGILGYVFRNEVDDRMQQEMLMTVPMYMNDSTVTYAWDAVQVHFKCCGISIGKDTKGYEIWLNRNSHFNANYRLPGSCCKNREMPLIEECLTDPQDINANLDDCYEKMKDFVKQHAMVIGGIGVGIACILIIGMALSMALFLLIR
ncbi:CD151 antigen-like [Centruroides sculpturatus]|uniref:CD151 antigen-like n=1 Tax=Centruroides sculpturatus TaxID=218467 RepID=UPI000C6D5B50|nr:CD151 antigen-like [Centruroides sculpturatus]XP_023239765.1 CD151 antigen-like [Centruroides sculpturatus]XP_023239766.1 CD151 antigen-like [Centruroides sculpturatus]XP_023239767.1 CD151 antigen-like [Centruroides sculpturatus]